MAAQPKAPLQQNIKYGVYWHQDLNDPTGNDSYLIATFDTERDAYDYAVKHAADEIEKHPEWGATYEDVRLRSLEIVGPGASIKLKYEYVMVIDDGNGNFQRVRGSVPGQQEKNKIGSVLGDEDEVPLERNNKNPEEPEPKIIQNAVYVYRNLDDPAASTTQLLCINVCFEDAKHIMHNMVAAEVRARNQLSNAVRCRLQNKRLTIFKVDSGQAITQYVIEEGRVWRAQFIKEEDWLNGESNGEALAFPRLSAPEPESGARQAFLANTEASEGSESAEEGEDEQTEDVGVSEGVEGFGEKVYCTCRTPFDGTKSMVECSGKNCPNKNWVHLACVGLKSDPKKRYWWCPDCRGSRRDAKRRKTRR